MFFLFLSGFLVFFFWRWRDGWFCVLFFFFFFRCSDWFAWCFVVVFVVFVREVGGTIAEEQRSKKKREVTKEHAF